MTSDSRRGILLYMAIADAYGMAYEFADDIDRVGNNNLRFEKNPKFPEYKAGHYTDDTQMSVANALVILDKDKPESDDFIESYLKTFKADPRVGYSRHMFSLLTKAEDTKDFRKKIDTDRTSSGAAMRAGVIGLLPDEDKVIKMAKEQAVITHDTKEAILSAQIVALAVHLIYYNKSIPRHLPHDLSKKLKFDWKEISQEDDSKSGLSIVRDAVTCVRECDTLAEVLRACVDLGPHRDTDTICAIAMAIASQSDDYDDDLPADMFKKLEGGKFGSDHLEKIDKALFKKFPRTEPKHVPAPTPPSP